MKSGAGGARRRSSKTAGGGLRKSKRSAGSARRSKVGTTRSKPKRTKAEPRRSVARRRKVEPRRRAAKTAVSTAPAPPMMPPTQLVQTQPSQPSTEEIARRAYDLYLQRERQGQFSDAVADWFAAEEELRPSAPHHRSPGH